MSLTRHLWLHDVQRAMFSSSPPVNQCIRHQTASVKMAVSIIKRTAFSNPVLRVAFQSFECRLHFIFSQALNPYKSENNKRMNK